MCCVKEQERWRESERASKKSPTIPTSSWVLNIHTAVASAANLLLDTHESSLRALVRGHGLDDIGVTGVCDGHDGHAEVASAGGAQLDVVAAVVVHAGLGKHGIVLQLGLPHGGDVVGHNQQLGCRVWSVCVLIA